jgi:uncharacterized protein
MQTPSEATLLRIFMGEDERGKGRPLYETIVLMARKAGLAGATVLRGPLGYGKSRILHTAKILRLSMDLPLVVEIVDEEAKIQLFLPQLEPFATKCLITLGKVTVLNRSESAGLVDTNV